MVQIGLYEVFGTIALVILAVVIVLLFVAVGWFIVWKLILSHFRFFREIFGMENGDESHGPEKRSPGSGASSSSDVPGHIRRRQQRMEKLNAASSLKKTAENEEIR